MSSLSASRGELADITERMNHALIAGTLDELAALVHPELINHEAVNEPRAARSGGAAAALAAGNWLRRAFSDLVWKTEHTVVDDDLVVSYGSLSGRHTGDFVVWTPQGTIERVFVPTGRTFTSKHAHFYRISDRFVIEHWAVRDDQAMSMQLGWIPPTPGFLLRCHRATKRHRRLDGSASVLQRQGVGGAGS